jgi:hypothetical protein
MSGPCRKGPAPNERPLFLIIDTAVNGGLFVDADHLLCRQPAWAIWKEQVPRFLSEVSEDDSDSDATTSIHQVAERRLWRELEHAFHTANDLGLENYATYQLRRVEEREKTGFGCFSSVLSRWFWGYGVRPIRVLGWLTLLFVIFSTIYRTQLSNFGMDLPAFPRHLTRLRAALVFSARTIWELKFGYEHSATGTFRLVTLAESILGKALIACFAYSLSHTSPLLNELLKKVLP